MFQMIAIRVIILLAEKEPQAFAQEDYLPYNGLIREIVEP